MLLKTKVTPTPEKIKGPHGIPPLGEYDLSALSVPDLEELWNQIALERADLMREMGKARTRYAETGQSALAYLNAARYAKHRRKLLLRAIEQATRKKRAEVLGEEFWNQVFYETCKTKLPPDKFQEICRQVDLILKHIADSGTLPP